MVWSARSEGFLKIQVGQRAFYIDVLYACVGKEIGIKARMANIKAARAACIIHSRAALPCSLSRSGFEAIFVNPQMTFFYLRNAVSLF